MIHIKANRQSTEQVGGQGKRIKTQEIDCMRVGRDVLGTPKKCNGMPGGLGDPVVPYQSEFLSCLKVFVRLPWVGGPSRPDDRGEEPGSATPLPQNIEYVISFFNWYNPANLPVATVQACTSFCSSANSNLQQFVVIPSKAGTRRKIYWIPAFAGMTK